MVRNHSADTRRLLQLGMTRVLFDKFKRDLVKERTCYRKDFERGSVLSCKSLKASKLFYQDTSKHPNYPCRELELSDTEILIALTGARPRSGRAFGIGVFGANSSDFFVVRVGYPCPEDSRTDTELYVSVIDCLGPPTAVFGAARRPGGLPKDVLEERAEYLDLLYALDRELVSQDVVERVGGKLAWAGLHVGGPIRILPEILIQESHHKEGAWDLPLCHGRGVLLDPVSLIPLATDPGKALRLLYGSGELDRLNLDTIMDNEPRGILGLRYDRQADQDKSRVTWHSDPPGTRQGLGLIGTLAQLGWREGHSFDETVDGLSSWHSQFQSQPSLWKDSPAAKVEALQETVRFLFEKWSKQDKSTSLSRIRQTVSTGSGWEAHKISERDTLPLAEARMVRKVVNMIPGKHNGRDTVIHDFDTEKQLFDVLRYTANYGKNGVSQIHHKVLGLILGSSLNTKTKIEDWRSQCWVERIGRYDREKKQSYCYRRMLPPAPINIPSDRILVRSYEEALNILLTPQEIRKQYSRKHAKRILKQRSGIVPSSPKLQESPKAESDKSSMAA